MATDGWIYAIHDVIVQAKHTLDAGDIISFTCKAGTFTNNVTALDMSNPAWKLSMTAGLVDCTKKASNPGGVIGLIVAILQGAVLCLLGPTIAMYGPSVPRFSSLIKAVVVSSYILLINSIVTVTEFTAFMVFERTVTLFISTLTVTYTSLNNPGAKAKAAGFALGTLIGTPLCAFISEQLYKISSIGCTGVGEKKEWFPNGEPTGCDLKSVEFQAVYQCMLLLKWLIITFCAYHGKKLLNFATATVGATMLIKGTIDLVKAVGFQVAPDAAAAILLAITPIRAWVTYGVALVGFFLQRYLIEQVDVPPPDGEAPTGKKKWIQKAKQPAVANIFCGVLVKVCNSIDGFLMRNLETLKDGGKGAMVRALTRKRDNNKSTTKKDTKIEVKVDNKESETAKVGDVTA